jgi:protein TonB
MKKYLIVFFIIVNTNTHAQEALTTEEPIFALKDVDVKPEFVGGTSKFYNFIANNFKTPAESNLKGQIITEFVVETDGSLTNIRVVKDLGYGTGAEAIRVVKKCPKWKPGEKNGKAVRTYFSFPININSY